MIDDLVELAAPQGTKRIFIDFLMETEEDVLRVAEDVGGEVFYLPDETNRQSVMFRDEHGPVLKSNVAKADPR